MKLALLGIVLQFWHFLLVGGFLLLFLYLGYLHRLLRQADKEREDFLQLLEAHTNGLKANRAPIALAVLDEEVLELDKDKIEKAIGTKLGHSAWQILNALLEDPTLRNKEIADQVFLSVEGVSSSLRRMYKNFDIQTTKNKKIALVKKALRISEEREEKSPL